MVLVHISLFILFRVIDSVDNHSIGTASFHDFEVEQLPQGISKITEPLIVPQFNVLCFYTDFFRPLILGTYQEHAYFWLTEMYSGSLSFGRKHRR